MRPSSSPTQHGSDTDSQADDLLPSENTTRAATQISEEDDVGTEQHARFAFIHQAENAARGKSDADDLPTIRSHAMRNVRRERRLRDEESRQSGSAVQSQTTPSTLPPSSETPPIDYASDELAQTDSLPESSSRSSPHTNAPALPYLSRYVTPRPTALDTVQDTTLRSIHGIVLDQLVPGFTQYLQYFVTTFAASVDPRNAHIPILVAQVAVAEGDAILLHTLCYAVTTHQALVKDIDIHSDWSILDAADRRVYEALVHHKAEALSLLQNRVSDPFQACTDTSILTVSLLLSTETFFGDRNCIAVHVKGLGQMVAQRGGCDAIPYEVYTYVVMADVKTSVLLLSPPSLPWSRRMSSLYVETEARSHSQQSLKSTSTGLDILQPPLSSLLGQDITSCCHVLSYLMDIIESSYHPSTAQPGLRAHFLVVEHQLLCISVENAIATCWRLALLLFCNVALWNWPKSSSLVQSLLDHLQQAVNSCGPDLQQQDYTDSFIWCLLLAVFASTDDEIQSWFINHLQDLLFLRDISNLRQVRSALPQCFYTNRVSEHHLRSVNTKLKLIDDLGSQTVPEERSTILKAG